MNTPHRISRREILALASAGVLAALAPVEAIASSVGSSNLPADFAARMQRVKSVLTELYAVRVEKKARKAVLDRFNQDTDDWLVAAKAHDDASLLERDLEIRAYGSFGGLLNGWEIPDKEEERKLIGTLNRCALFGEMDDVLGVGARP